MSAFFQRWILHFSGLVCGGLILVMASTAAWSATPGSGSHLWMSDGLLVSNRSKVWSGSNRVGEIYDLF